VKNGGTMVADIEANGTLPLELSYLYGSAALLLSGRPLLL